MSLLIALAAVPGMLGTQEAIRQSQQKERREEHRARRCNLIVRCIKSSQWSRELDGRPLVLRNGAIYIDTCAPSDKAPDHQLGGYFLPYPDSKYEGFVTTTTDAAPIMNWVYVHSKTHQIRYGVRKDAQPHITGPFDCTRQERRLTLQGWEGFCAVEVEPGVWGAFFDVHDDGLRALMDDGLIGRNTRVLEIELTRAEKRFKKDPAARNADQTINRGKVLTPDHKEVIVEPPKPAMNGSGQRANGTPGAAPPAEKPATLAPISTLKTPKQKPVPVTPGHSSPPTPSSPPPIIPPAASTPQAHPPVHEKANMHHVRHAMQRLQTVQGSQTDDQKPTKPASQLPLRPDVESVHPLLRGHQDPLRTTPPYPTAPAQEPYESNPAPHAPQRPKTLTPPASPNSQSVDFEDLLQARSSRSWPETPPSPAVVRVEPPVVLATYGLPGDQQAQREPHHKKAPSSSSHSQPPKRVSKPPSAHANSNGGARHFAALDPPPPLPALLYEEARREEHSRSRIMPAVRKMLRRGSAASERRAPLGVGAEDDGRDGGRVRRSFTLGRPRRSGSQSGESEGRGEGFRESLERMRVRAGRW